MVIILKKYLKKALYKLMKRVYEMSGRTLTKKQEFILIRNINDCIKESGFFYNIKNKIIKKRSNKK